MAHLDELASQEPNPVLLEILNQRFRSIAEEMGYALQRTGYTVFVNETADLGVALVNGDGEIFGYPVNIGITTFANLDCSAVIKAFDHYEDGDIIITNDAYTSGAMASHSPDINLLKPIFHEGELICFALAYVHSTDIGGRVPGSVSPSSTDIFQEGLRIPPTKLYEAGVLNEGLLQLILLNCRAPEDNRGDLRAIVTALKVGDARVKEMVKRYGLADIRSAIAKLLSYSEKRARMVIERIPDGVYTFADYLDDDLVSELPIRICVAITISGGSMHIDFTGTDPQLRAAFNIYSNGKPHPWLVFKIMFLLLTQERDIPVNAGLMRPITIFAPEGSVVNCAYPAAIGMRTTTGLRVQDAIFGALAKAMPHDILAAGAGAISPLVFAEPNTLTGGFKVTVLEPLVGGAGAHADGDGAHSRDVVDLANLRNNPIEIVESAASVRILRYGLAPDSCGAGRYRGGCGSILEFEVLAPDCSLTPRGMERHRFHPWGLMGGRHAAGGSCSVKRSGDADFVVVPKIDSIRLSVGDLVRIVVAGGAGYGNPLEREAERVLDDVINGFITGATAERDYGVVIRDGRIDEDATTALRARRSETASEATLFDLGPAREAYEELWTEPVWRRFMEIVYALPVAFRSEVRAKLWHAMTARHRNGARHGLEELETEWQTVRTMMIDRRGAVAA